MLPDDFSIFPVCMCVRDDWFLWLNGQVGQCVQLYGLWPLGLCVLQCLWVRSHPVMLWKAFHWWRSRKTLRIWTARFPCDTAEYASRVRCCNEAQQKVLLEGLGSLPKQMYEKATRFWLVCALDRISAARHWMESNTQKTDGLTTPSQCSCVYCIPLYFS